MELRRLNNMNDCKYLEPTDIQCFLCSDPNCSDRLNADCATCIHVETECPDHSGGYCGKWERPLPVYTSYWSQVGKDDE